MAQVPQVSYVDLAELLMAATAISVEILAVAIGVGAFLGYRAIKKAAKATAEKATREKLKEYFEGEGVPQKLDDAIQRYISAYSNPSGSYPLNEDGTPNGEERLADDYPNERTDRPDDRPPAGPDSR